MTDVRVHFREGLVLGVDELRAEQSYLRTRRAQHDGGLHGAGVLAGLAARIEGDAGHEEMAIDAGVAVTPRGTIVRLMESTKLPRDRHALVGDVGAGGSCDVWIVAREREGDPPRVAGAGARRVVDEVDLLLSAADADPPAGDAVRVARFAGQDGKGKFANAAASSVTAAELVSASGLASVQLAPRGYRDPNAFVVRVADGAGTQVERLAVRRSGTIAVNGSLRAGGAVVVRDTGLALNVASGSDGDARDPRRQWAVEAVQEEVDGSARRSLRIVAGPQPKSPDPAVRFEVKGRRGDGDTPLRLLALEAGGTLRLGERSPEGPRVVLDVEGRVELAPLRADPSVPLFRQLLVLATQAGFRSAAADEGFTLVIKPVVIVVGEDWTYSILVSKRPEPSDAPIPELLFHVEALDPEHGTPPTPHPLLAVKVPLSLVVQHTDQRRKPGQLTVVGLITGKRGRVPVFARAEARFPIEPKLVMRAKLPEKINKGESAPLELTFENGGKTRMDVKDVHVSVDGVLGPAVAGGTLEPGMSLVREATITPADDVTGKFSVTAIATYRFADLETPSNWEAALYSVKTIKSVSVE